MAKTQLTDIIEPQTFLDSVVETTATVSRLFQSSIIETSSEFNDRASSKGTKIDMPFWHDLSGDSEVLSDSAALTPARMDQGQDEAAIHRRGKAWSANDLPAAVAGSDPLKALSDRVAAFWARSMQTNILIPSLQGIFATALASTHVLDIAGSGLTNKAMSQRAIIDAVGLLGDQWDMITALSVHSVVFQGMQHQNLITFEALSEQQLRISRFLGREVITDDGLPNPSANVYTSYFFGAGAFGVGNGGEPGLPVEKAVEMDRDTLAGDDILVHRRHFIMHPRGVRFTGSPVGVSPSTAELQLGANWAKVWEDKNIRIVAVHTTENTPAYDGTT
jgi:hypothetical protein